MLQKLRGIVLHHINYGETSLILHLYTDQKGRISVIIPGARGKRKNKRISLFHNLSLLDLEVYYKPSRDLQQIKEARPVIPMAGLTGDPIKSTMALFLSEVLYRTLKEEEANPELFSFLENTLKYFDLAEEGVANFHLFIMVHLSRFLGFFPVDNQQKDSDWFDLTAGQFSSSPPEIHMRLDPAASSLLAKFMRSNLEETNALKMNRHQRNDLLAGLLEFYKIHLQGMGEIRSYAVLKDIFDS